MTIPKNSFVYFSLVVSITLILGVIFYYCVEWCKTRFKSNGEPFENLKINQMNDIIVNAKSDDKITEISFDTEIEITKNTTLDLNGETTFYVENNDSNKDVFLVKNDLTTYVHPGKVYKTKDAQLDIIYYVKPFKIFINK